MDDPTRTMSFSIWWLFTYYVRPILKWFLRKTTGLCELQRICYGSISGAPRVKGVEHSLSLSRRTEIRLLVAHLNDIASHRRFVENEREFLKGNRIFQSRKMFTDSMNLRCNQHCSVSEEN